MSHLHLIENENIAQSFPLPGGEVLVGREDYCDIRLAYPGISRKHMLLLTVMDDTFLEDLSSKNGTFVNGQLSKKCVLNDGDIIQVGEVELRFEKEAAVNDTDMQEDPDATTVVTPGQFGPNTRAARESGAQVQGISPVAHLVGASEQFRHEPQLQPQPKSGWWGRILAWFGR